ncbi:hypothetical protein RBG61_11085 [Paludicola sp. MB14-C6]|uniref:hypothetical protein n=1 Tax=Paludihabitans sp. MB14-C6 TaxID=3070656 RepID=UPI0027DD6D67|nr:hypothetical protein [Paludicola sp. MB14-C6]WMJ22528.1 hypothetical protein RBG61_11085 [Paludicola sp. MB14-C6]
MKIEKYLKPVIVLLIAVIIGLGVTLRVQIKEKNETVKQVNQAFTASLSSSASDLNFDYTKADTQAKLSQYVKLTSHLQAAAAIFPQTQYAKNNRNFGYLLECLSQYFREQYESNGLDIVGERQTKLYNYLLDIARNPKDTKLMQELDEYIDSFDKPIRPDSLSHKMP